MLDKSISLYRALIGQLIAYTAGMSSLDVDSPRNLNHAHALFFSVRVNLRLLRLFPINHHRPVYTVEQILQGNTEELKSLQKIIFKDYGENQR